MRSAEEMDKRATRGEIGRVNGGRRSEALSYVNSRPADMASTRRRRSSSASPRRPGRVRPRSAVMSEAGWDRRDGFTPAKARP